MLLLYAIIFQRHFAKAKLKLPNLYIRKELLIKFLVLLLLFAVCFVVSGTTHSSQEKRNYTIYKNDKPIGFLNAQRTFFGKQTSYSVRSVVDVKFIKKFTAIGEEHYIFNRDTLIFSSIYRKMNKKIKVDQELNWVNDIYQIEDKHKKISTYDKVVKDNIVKLFFNEPLNIHHVFSDRFGEMVPIKKIDQHTYRLDMPNGSYSVFYYENGVCKTIESVGTFYRIQLKAKNLKE